MPSESHVSGDTCSCGRASYKCIRTPCAGGPVANESKPEVRIGSWVRFHQGGTLVIGVVQYLRARTTYPTWEGDAVTDNGTVMVRDILEVRNAE